MPASEIVATSQVQRSNWSASEYAAWQMAAHVSQPIRRSTAQATSSNQPIREQLPTTRETGFVRGVEQSNRTDHAAIQPTEYLNGNHLTDPAGSQDIKHLFRKQERQQPHQPNKARRNDQSNQRQQQLISCHRSPVREVVRSYQSSEVFSDLQFSPPVFGASTKRTADIVNSNYHQPPSEFCELSTNSHHHQSYNYASDSRNLLKHFNCSPYLETKSAYCNSAALAPTDSESIKQKVADLFAINNRCSFSTSNLIQTSGPNSSRVINNQAAFAKFCRFYHEDDSISNQQSTEETKRSASGTKAKSLISNFHYSNSNRNYFNPSNAGGIRNSSESDNLFVAPGNHNKTNHSAVTEEQLFHHCKNSNRKSSRNSSALTNLKLQLQEKSSQQQEEQLVRYPKLDDDNLNQQFLAMASNNKSNNRSATKGRTPASGLSAASLISDNQRRSELPVLANSARLQQHLRNSKPTAIASRFHREMSAGSENTSGYTNSSATVSEAKLKKLSDSKNGNTGGLSLASTTNPLGVAVKSSGPKSPLDPVKDIKDVLNGSKWAVRRPVNSNYGDSTDVNANSVAAVTFQDRTASMTVNSDQPPPLPARPAQLSPPIGYSAPRKPVGARQYPVMVSPTNAIPENNSIRNLLPSPLPQNTSLDATQVSGSTYSLGPRKSYLYQSFNVKHFSFLKSAAFKNMTETFRRHRSALRLNQSAANENLESMPEEVEGHASHEAEDTFTGPFLPSGTREPQFRGPASRIGNISKPNKASRPQKIQIASYSQTSAPAPVTCLGGAKQYLCGMSHQPGCKDSPISPCYDYATLNQHEKREAIKKRLVNTGTATDKKQLSTVRENHVSTSEELTNNSSSQASVKSPKQRNASAMPPSLPQSPPPTTKPLLANTAELPEAKSPVTKLLRGSLKRAKSADRAASGEPAGKNQTPKQQGRPTHKIKCGACGFEAMRPNRTAILTNGIVSHRECFKCLSSKATYRNYFEDY